MTELYVGRRVRFIDPDSFDPRIGDAYLDVRGRVMYADATLVSVLQDGKTYARWLKPGAVQAERFESEHDDPVGRPLGPTP